MTKLKNPEPEVKSMAVKNNRLFILSVFFLLCGPLYAADPEDRTCQMPDGYVDSSLNVGIGGTGHSGKPAPTPQDTQGKKKGAGGTGLEADRGGIGGRSEERRVGKECRSR